MRPLMRLSSRIAVVVLCALVCAAGGAHAQDQDTSYEQKLMRLSEVLGAMRHLRNICGTGEGQLWRDQMIRLLDAEAPSPARRARLVRQFNKGYQFYQRS